MWKNYASVTPITGLPSTHPKVAYQICGSTGASRAATFAMAEKALVAVRARERAAVRALDACLVSLERAEKEAAKAQAELEGKVKPR